MAGKSLGLVALTVTLAAAAFAADPPARSGDQRLICRGGERRLGTHTRTPQRCRSAEQWRQEDEEKGRIPVTLQVTQGQNGGRVTPTPQ